MKDFTLKAQIDAHQSYSPKGPTYEMYSRGAPEGPWIATVGEIYYDSRDPGVRGELVRVYGDWIDEDDDDRPTFYKELLVKRADGSTITINERFAHPVDPSMPKAPLKFLTYAEMQELHEPEWLIEGVIAEQTSALLFGKSNSFKSFLAIDMACSVATNRPWHGLQVSPARQDEGDHLLFDVLYVATEGAIGVARQRIPGWMEAHGIPPEDAEGLHLYPQEIALDDDKAVDDLIETLHDSTIFFSLIVLDIFGATMMGPETSDETARAWVRNINRIMRETSAAVLTVAHTGWADETRARMHTHFWGSFDTRMKAEGDKDARTSVLKIDRHKDADSSGEWGFRMDEVTLPDGKTTLYPVLCDEVETKQKRRVSGKPAVALQALSEALIDKGRTIAGPNYPSCPVVSLEDWKAMCARHGLTDSDNPETLKKSFQRAKAALIDKGLVKQFDNNVWKVEADA